MKFVYALLSLFLALTACAEAKPEPPPLAGARLGGPFALKDGNGKLVRDSDFAGKYRLVYFGYTFCPDICPNDVAKLMRGYASFEKADAAKAAKLQPIFITIDPERDGPKEVKAFTEAFHPKLIGLTGTLDEIKGIAKAYGVYFQKVENQGFSGYLMDHSNVAILYGPKGEPIAIIQHDAATSPDQIAANLDKWIQ